MRFFLFLLITPCVAWSNIANVWKEHNFKKIAIPINGIVQNLCVKKNSCIGFYNNKHVLVNKGDRNMKIKVQNLIDYDVSFYKDEFYNLITFYDKTFKVFFFDKVIIDTEVPIIRNFLTDIEHDLLGIAVSLDGTIYIIKENGVNEFKLNESISQVELYDNKLYLLNTKNQIKVYCLKKENIINTLEFDVKVPITHFSVSENELYVAYDKTIQGNRLNINTPFKVVKICTDQYKCVALLEDTSVVCHDIRTGEKWFRVKTNCDLNYFNKLKVSHSSFYVDGTKDELAIYNLVNQENYEMLLDEFQLWLNK